MSTPKEKRDLAFVGRSSPVSAQKTRATAEAGSKEGHFYKPLANEFRRDGFTYRRIAREGNIAIYEQRWTGCPEPRVCYEVVRIRRRDGFQIGGRFVEPAEVYPNSEAWGMDGFTFTDRNKAWTRFLKYRWKNQQGEEGRRSRIEKIIQIICR